MTGPDGKPAEMTGQSLEVVRRQAGGHWCFVIDEPFGAGA
jgi:ketosteroid isomerase-like protein